PRAPRVGRLHLESTVQLDGVTDDLVGDERVVVRIGDDHLRTRAGGRRRPRDLYAFPGQRQRELGERWGRQERIVDAPGEDFPAALVSAGVVQLLADVAVNRDDQHHPLGERERLVDQRALRGGDQLARERGGRG